MSWSLGEIGALSVKAARGSGLPWGLADEAGYAVKWLQARRLPGTAALCRYLSWRETGRSVHWPNATTEDTGYCPLQTGAAYGDGALPLQSVLDGVQSPLLMLPFVALRAGNRTISIELNDMRLAVTAAGVGYDGPDTRLLAERATCTLSQGHGADIQINHHATRPLPRLSAAATCCVATLEKFAARTYAPSTEQSRRTGAGAGLSDND
jgi:hypothetical protein